jgi:hypothetical protein
MMAVALSIIPAKHVALYQESEYSPFTTPR